MVRLQALVLCCAGLPAGLLIGWVIGYLIAPTVTRELVSAEAASANPVIFLFAAVFALLTVLISCRRPARLAGERLAGRGGAVHRRGGLHPQKGPEGKGKTAGFSLPGWRGPTLAAAAARRC